MASLPSFGDVVLTINRELGVVDFSQLSKDSNVLHFFRSYTYNFTLSCLEDSAFQQELTPEQMVDYSSRFVIAKSGGKGTTGLSTSTAKAEDVDQIKKFNEFSPGRFDFYFGDVEIGTLMNPTQRAGYSQATKISFTIIEPYGLGGFLEALMAASLAAGHPNFLASPYCLKLEFQGYPDSLITNELAPNSINPGATTTRYFPFRFAGVGTKSDENGTRYECTAIPMNEFGMGDPNKLVATMTLSGGPENTVGAALKDMVVKLNDAVKGVAVNNSRAENNTSKNAYDTYVIEIDPKIAEQQLADLQKDEIQTNMKNTAENNGSLDNRQANGSAGKKWNKEFSVSFANSSNIHDCISAIIRDSEWVKDIKKNLTNRIDEAGLVEYFIISIKSEPKPDVWDAVRSKPCYTYTFQVKPYKIHVAKIPGLEADTIDTTKLIPYIRRNYNYLYTGQNKDVLQISLNYDTLYFQSMAVYVGNSKSLTRGQGSGISSNDNPIKIIEIAPPKEVKQGDGVTPPPLSINHALSDIQGTGEATRPFQAGDAYTVFAQTLHAALMDNIRAKMLEMDILGDPFYLVQSGIGNMKVDEDTDNFGITKTDGSAAYQSGDIYVNVKLNSAYDIDRESGMMKMNGASNFSGIYIVNEVQSKFADGQFKQHLKMMKLPDQPGDTGQKPAAKIEDPFIPEDLKDWYG
jgi:hypothetical protein